MKCCCGSLECVFLKHNQSVLDNVEKDVHTAARMGQALLARHEAYMADAERDRYELTARIEQLEMDNKELEARNARTIEENRDLLDQLELLNSTVNDSEGRIKSLEATLLSSQQTVRRLEGETARAEALERQLISLEQEQAELQSSLILSQEEARSAMFRWKRAERGINDLQEQLERMEKEAKEERDHHVEMINRIERQREMEKELNTAAGRLKGAAAAKSLNHGNGRTSVVGHFVRDLLQDNANLQHGIAELREMLMNSNDEIQALRDQLVYHQPLGDGEINTTQTLRSELEPKDPPSDQQQSSRVSQELHIHHHYHVSTPKQEPKKPRKKRLGITPNGGFVPLGTSLPNASPTSLVRHQSTQHSKRDSQRSNRWSGSIYSEQTSEFAPSSVPSSPQSHRRNSLFDHTIDTSFPTSPATTVDPMSPGWPCSHRRQQSNMSTRSFQIPSNLALPPAVPPQAHAIIEESDDTEDTPDVSGIDSSAEDEELPGDFSVVQEDTEAVLEDVEPAGLPAYRIRRTISHESIMSLSGGLDIHTLKSRPSQLTIGHISSATSVTGSSTVTARPMLSRDSGRRSSALLRDNFEIYTQAGSQRTISNANERSEPSKFGKWVVSWRPWGGGNGGAKGGEGGNDGKPSSRNDKEKEAQKIRARPPGVNQPGIIPGFPELIAAARSRGAPHNTSPGVIDGDALRDGLAE
ncbi:hypothetical protein F5X99DRAFT_419664 [Biscogniauxia marginata]|nr:hypothetical protein F5X99DRAFT_419664 [Biscogniauxia marginata]